MCDLRDIFSIFGLNLTGRPKVSLLVDYSEDNSYNSSYT